MNRLTVSVLSIFLTLVSLPVFPATERAAEGDWPRTVPIDRGTVTIYSPQIDQKNGDDIKFRAALAYRASAASEPVFGAGWFESTVEIDTARGIVHPGKLTVTDTRFPAGTYDVEPGLSAALASQSPDWNLDFSVEEFEAALKIAEAESMAEQSLNTAPPDIIYRDNPALLISMDGEPILREIEDSPYKAVINTPYPLITDERHYYLNAAKDVWYRADKATGPYQFDSKPPADIAAMVKPEDETTEPGSATEAVTAANAPEIIVSTKPAELIVTDGPAAFVPLVDDLLVLQNSDSDVFMHVSSQEYYIVLAGRWYQAGSLNGPWSYQNADDLPKAFADIPKDSDQADSRVYVAGTEEAREAVMDSQVPQTAAVKKGEVDIDVKYDGEPVYQPVDGTDMVYIQNTGSTVMVAGGLYYLVENGVWYVSSSQNGPWQVSDHRPEQVDTILPTSPVYNTRYVQVYDSTPNVVYVGYTPGYTGSYVYHNTVFYGTGWHYRPWVSPYYYYPRFSTWGFNVSYNSWSGWSFGLSWGWGPFSVGYYSGGYWHNHHYWHHRYYGHWGPRGYRPRPAHYRHGGNRHAYNSGRGGGHGGRDYADNNRRGGNGRGDPGQSDGGRNGRGRDGQDRGGQRPGDNPRNDNLYRDESQRAAIADTRDRQTRPTERRTDSTRQANNAKNYGSQKKSDSSLKNGERNRTSPVRMNDLRVKASGLDSNFSDSRSLLVADSGGSTYRGTQRPVQSNERVSRKSLSAKSPGNKATTPTAGKRPNPSQNSSRSNNRASGKSNARQKTQPIASTSSRQPQINVTGGQSSGRSSASVNAPAQRSQPGEPGKKSKQRQPRESSTPTQKQDIARRSPEPKSSQVRNSGNQAQTRNAPKNAGNRATAKPASGNGRQSKSNATPSSRKSGGSKTQPAKSASGRSAQKAGATNRGKRDQPR